MLRKSTVERGKQLREQKNGKQLRNCCNSSKLPPNQAPSPRYSRARPSALPRANPPGGYHDAILVVLFYSLSFFPRHARLALSSANSEIKSERNPRHRERGSERAYSFPVDTRGGDRCVAPLRPDPRNFEHRIMPKCSHS